MDFKYKQLEQELSALSKVFSELGVRLSEVAKEVTAPGVNPPEKLIEQISVSRAGFDSVRSAVHGHATAMLVSPLPKLGELVSIAAIDSLFKACAAAEEAKISIDAEREQALAILGRVLSIIHRETADFKPLQECHAKIGALRNAVLNVVWPHRHPESAAIIEHKHPTTDFLHFVENLDRIDDERWMTLETAITETYGKPLFVAASRGKLAIVADNKPNGLSAAGKPAVGGPVAARPTAAPEAAKPAVAAEKPVEKKIVVEKAPEKPEPVPAVSAAPPPAVSAEKKPTAPPATIPAAPAAANLTTPATADKAPQKPVAPPPPAPSVTPAPVAPIQTTPVVAPEKKPAPPAAPAPVPAHPAAAASTPVVPQAATPVGPTPVTATAPPVTAPAMPPTTPAVSTHVPAAPAAAATNTTPPASPLSVNINSLAALATATEPPEKKPVPVPADALDKQRKEPRLASPAPQSVSKPESKPQEGPESMRQEAMQDGLAGDAQRPQRWGFWRGNR